MSNQLPFIDIDFVDNPEPRCPCVLLVDTSTSMQGAPIRALTEGVRLFQEELLGDKLASKRVEIAIVSFGQCVEVLNDFTGPGSFTPPELDAQGSTPMGEAVVRACSLLEERKREYKSAGISYFRPWIFLLTDGEPTDYGSASWASALDLIHDGERSKKLLFFAVAVNDANQGKLNELCPPNRPSMKLKGLSFRELFTWLSSSLRSVSSANPGATLNLPAPSGWAAVDV